MGMAAPSPKGQVRPGINITPLVDVALVVLIIGFSMVGDGLEELLDPRRSKSSR